MITTNDPEYSTQTLLPTLCFTLRWRTTFFIPNCNPTKFHDPSTPSTTNPNLRLSSHVFQMTPIGLVSGVFRDCLRDGASKEHQAIEQEATQLVVKHVYHYTPIMYDPFPTPYTAPRQYQTDVVPQPDRQSIREESSLLLGSLLGSIFIVVGCVALFLTRISCNSPRAQLEAENGHSREIQEGLPTAHPSPEKAGDPFR